MTKTNQPNDMPDDEMLLTLKDVQRQIDYSLEECPYGKGTVARGYLETAAFRIEHAISMRRSNLVEKPTDEKKAALERADELLDRINIQCNAVGHPVGGISELKLLFRACLQDDADLVAALEVLRPQNDDKIGEYDYYAMGFESGWNRCVERISEIIAKHRSGVKK